MEPILIMAALALISVAVEAARKSREKRQQQMPPGQSRTRAGSGSSPTQRTDPRRAPPPATERDLPPMMRQLEEALFGRGREPARERREFEEEEEELEIIEEVVVAPRPRRSGRRLSPLERLERALAFGTEDTAGGSGAAPGQARGAGSAAHLERVLSHAPGPVARAILASEVLGPPLALREPRQM